MDNSRKPTTKEFDEIVADMVRIYQKDSNLMPDMQNREEIVGHEDNTDKQEAEYWLKNARVVIVELIADKSGVIFWGGNCSSWVSILTVNEDGLCLQTEKNTDMIYWGI